SVSRFLSESSTSRSVGFVVSPIVALIQDQVKYLNNIGIPSTHLHSVNEPSEWSKCSSLIKKGHYSLVFASPETLTSKPAKELLASREVRSSICGLFVDECHCIAKWGHTDDKTRAFREQYSALAELRAFIPSHVPVIALTATATDKVKGIVLKSLALANVYEIKESPDRPNIKYCVVNIPNRPGPDTFDWLIDSLKSKKQETPRTIVYCRSHDQCTNLYAIFYASLGRQCQHFAMYHGSTDPDVQRLIVEDFEKPDGTIRMLFATIAFGMGVNVRGVNSIIHVGPSSAVDDYMQESGRCGRDGTQSVAILLSFPGMFRGTKTEESMKQYVANKEVCRRQKLLDSFGAAKCPDEGNKHQCCDICATSCTCTIPTCPAVSQEETDLVKHLGEKGTAYHAPPERLVSEDQREDLRASLLEYRDRFLDSNQTRYLAGSDIASGIPIAFVNDIVRDCHYELTLEQFNKRYPFYDEDHALKVWTLVQNVVQHCPAVDQLREDQQADIDGEISESNADSDNSGVEEEAIEENYEREYDDSDSDYERRLISSSSEDLDDT
ncbi:uncharacterized protein, partial [Amphiura filiformis]|uniref:uncharacterized protein n=1 Tax=Amphiura filiformis TaxID=82378 RepID=UPI003B215FF5